MGGLREKEEDEEEDVKMKIVRDRLAGFFFGTCICVFL